MTACMIPIKAALDAHKAELLAEIDLQIAAHDNHARVTSSEPAYRAACNLARAMREARAHLAVDDFDAIAGFLRYEIPISVCAERVLRRHEFS